jgi:hypothetical protein
VSDPLIDAERHLLEVQKKLLDVLDPFDDEARIRIMRAVAAYYAPINANTLDKLILRREKARKQQELEGGA